MSRTSPTHRCRYDGPVGAEGRSGGIALATLVPGVAVICRCSAWVESPFRSRHGLVDADSEGWRSTRSRTADVKGDLR